MNENDKYKNEAFEKQELMVDLLGRLDQLVQELDSKVTDGEDKFFVHDMPIHLRIMRDYLEEHKAGYKLYTAFVVYGKFREQARKSSLQSEIEVATELSKELAFPECSEICFAQRLFHLKQLARKQDGVNAGDLFDVIESEFPAK